MGPKRKRSVDDSVRAFSFTLDDFSDSEPPPDVSQTNIALRARHDTRGRTSTQTEHLLINADEEEPNLDFIYSALHDNDNDSQLSAPYGGEELVAPLEDDLPSSFAEPDAEVHFLEEDTTTVSPHQVIIG